MSVETLVTILNDATGTLFGICVVVLIWLFVYVRRRNVTPTHEAITVASWAAFIISLPLRFLGLMNDWQLGIIIILCIGSIVLLNNREQ